ncbi:arginase [Pararhizobium polonicum]|uniref:Arginase n=1 Tax=Pararhizobium polonicum TaxID=1612624 RepID=A0A1C7P0T1_9HYPH|nr:arginase family protein [Pararhizobium polonicum]OBZ94923.1 arginase [Pararhizobium polonicum]
MQLLLLHLDDALELQPDFTRACLNAGAGEIQAEEDGRAIRLWGKQKSLNTVADRLARAMLRGRKDAHLCFMGSGDFHHVTALLLEVALAKDEKPVTVIHFDNHPDWVHFNGGMHCGSWVNRAVRNPLVHKVITVGVCSSDLHKPEWKGANLSLLSSGDLELFPYDHPPSRVKKQYGSGASYRQDTGALWWNTISAIGEQNFIDRLLSRIETDAVYLTIDKDVLALDDAVTNWDQGRMRLPYLLSLITEIGTRHRIVGADVTGDYSTPAYAGTLWMQVAKRAEILMDQPGRPSDLRLATNINSAANHTLLAVLSEIMQ